jgi:protocatechuate 3,4-dioxygenase beta subunit
MDKTHVRTAATFPLAMLWLALTTLAVSAQSGPANTTANRAVGISGQVLDEQGRPVGDVSVEYFLGMSKGAARTDAQGQFMIQAEPPGQEKEIRYGRFVAATADGSRQAFLNYDKTKQDPENRGPQLVLRPAREFAVTVVDAAGAGIEGATVAASSEYTKVGQARTDTAGKATLRIPADATPQYVAALKSGAGLDYVAFWQAYDTARTDPYRLEPNHAGPLNFVLNGARTVVVKVVDRDGGPLAGVRVYPWYFQKPKKGADLNSGLPDFNRVTDANGVAEFDYIPADNQGKINFWTRLDGYCTPDRCLVEPKAERTETVATLYPMVSVTGTTVDEQGRPVGDADVRVIGESYAFDRFSGQTKAADDGSFEILVYPDMYYMFAADHEKLASPPHMMMIGREQLDNVRIVMQPGTRFYGQFTAGPDKSPVAKASVSLIQTDNESYYKLPSDKKFPGPTVGRKGIQLQSHRNVTTDDQGRFEFFAAPGGNYLIRAFGPPNFEQTKIGPLPEGEMEYNLYTPEDATPKFIKGRVVLRDKPETTVPEVILSGRPVGWENLRVGEGVSDKQGNFTVRRGKLDLYLHGETADKSLRGFVLVPAGEQTATLAVGPTASARGVLVDSSGQPAAGRQLEFGVRIDNPEGTFSYNFGGQATTTDDGSFELLGLIPGHTYQVNVANEFTPEGYARSWESVGKVAAERAERVDIGKLQLRPPRVQKTWKDFVAEAFAKPEPLPQRLETARTNARLTHQHVLVLLAAPDAPVAQQFLRPRFDYENENEAFMTALADFALLVVNARTDEKNARAWAMQNHVAWPDAAGMTLAILDHDGKLLEQTSDKELAGATASTLDVSRAIALLKQHATTKPDAQKLLDDALARAKKEDKRVLVEQSGAYCGWCVKLAKYLETNATLVDKDYVWITIDPRFPNGEQVIKRLRMKDGGIPWITILDADGKTLITSDSPSGNIGYPADTEGRAHWEKMIRTTARRLDENQIKLLLEPLQ